MNGDVASVLTLSLTNSGLINGAVTCGYLEDSIDNSLGVITGVVNLGDGADTYDGGDGRDRVRGGAGSDTIDLGGGNDVYLAGDADGKDDIDAGDGVDTYDASSATLGIIVDLSAATTARTVGNDVIINFENIVGGLANDAVTGADDANRIAGGAGADRIDGQGGNDRLIGGAGADFITGGAGRDIMTGGGTGGGNESDRFIFADGDSGATSKTRDVITGFTDHGSASAPYATGADLIDLRLIDAKTNVTGDQAFSFNAVEGAAFSGSAGSLIWQQYTAFALVSGDTNGDGKADFVIQVNGTHTLLAHDFLL